MTTLTALIALVSFGHMAWHNEYRFGVKVASDGSWWVCDFHGATFYQYPVNDMNEALESFGKTVANDPRWQLL